MQELYLSDGALIPEQAWVERITSLQTKVLTGSAPLMELERDWLVAFERAVLARVGDGMNGLLFSGGVDSTFIGFVLAKNNIPFTCYTVGFKDPRTKDPEDVEMACKIAKRYGWKHRVEVYDLEAFAPLVQETVHILGDAANPVSVGVGVVVVAAAHVAAADKVSVLFGGLGSEEIFAGYHRHDKARSTGGLVSESWRGMKAMYLRDLVRDARIGQALNIHVPTPFMDEEVIVKAMCMPEELKIKDGHKKYVLRVMAQKYGLEKEFAFRPKRAAQYGSRTHKVIARLAKRRELSESDYIDSLH